MDDDMVICRCEEVTLGEIKQAIKNGAKTITEVKRRTRAGMGLCQGRTCEKMVEKILIQELDIPPEKVDPATDRAPVRPVTFGTLAGETDEKI